MAKDEYIRFRCDPELKVRFTRVAERLRRSESDLSRLLFEDYVAEQERALGLTGLAALHESTPSYRASSSRPTPGQKRIGEIIRKRKRPPKS